jgi:hypothetical protein
MPEKIDELIVDLESRGLGWSLDHNGGLIEARIWHWPYVIGRYRPSLMAPLVEMMQGALQQVDLDYYAVLKPEEEIKPYYRTHEGH